MKTTHRKPCKTTDSTYYSAHLSPSGQDDAASATATVHGRTPEPLISATSAGKRTPRAERKNKGGSRVMEVKVGIRDYTIDDAKDHSEAVIASLELLRKWFTWAKPDYSL